MKTIKNQNSEEIKRVGDKEAEKLVRQLFSVWKYCPKQHWKNENRKQNSKKNIDDDTTSRKKSDGKTKKSASR